MNAATTRAAVKLAVFAVVTLFLTYILASTIGSLGTGETTAYKADFTDVTGLLQGDDVRVAGVMVGSVKDIKIKDRRIAEVTIGVERGVPVFTNAHIKVRYRNLVGQRYLALMQGSDIPLKPNGTLPLANTEPALDLSTLLNGFKPLFTALEPADVNKLSFEMIQTLQGEGGTFTTLLVHTASLTSTLADRDAVIGRVVKNLDAVLTTVSEKDAQLSQLIATLQKLVTDLKGDREAILGSLGGIDDLVTTTTGYLRDVRPPLTADLKRLDVVAGNLAKGRGEIDRTLRLLPRKLNAIIRTATYGGWFNFYLCKADANITLPTGDTLTFTDFIKNNTAACNQDVSQIDVNKGPTR